MKLVAFRGLKGQRFCVALWKLRHRVGLDRTCRSLFISENRYPWITVPLTVKTKQVLHQTSIDPETVQIRTIPTLYTSYDTFSFTVTESIVNWKLEVRLLQNDEKVSPRLKSKYNMINVSKTQQNTH